MFMMGKSIRHMWIKGILYFHPIGSGYYMYIETSNGNTGYKADLVSKLIPPNPPAHPYCFGLALNMYGSEMGSINIYIKVRLSN